MQQDTFLREQLANFLKGGQAHMRFEEMVKNFPTEHINDVFSHGEYTFWHLLEHIRRTQKDILDFLVSEKYQEPSWPKDYWPKKEEKATKKDWDRKIDAFGKDQKALITLIEDSKTDFSARVPNGNGQIFLREFLLAVDHAAYHIGEFAIMRQVYKLW